MYIYICNLYMFLHIQFSVKVSRTSKTMPRRYPGPQDAGTRAPNGSGKARLGSPELTWRLIVHSRVCLCLCMGFREVYIELFTRYHLVYIYNLSILIINDVPPLPLIIDAPKRVLIVGSLLK